MIQSLFQSFFYKKIFVRQKKIPVCPCPTPLFTGAKNTFISCGICDVKIPNYPSMGNEGGSGRGSHACLIFFA